MTGDSAWNLPRLKRDSFIRGLEFHETLASTNDRALELTNGEKFESPFLVLTDRQTAGRGRGANQWWSSEGALTFSVIIDPSERKLSQECWSLVSLAAGLAVCDAMRELVPEAAPRLKWPNDVYVNNRKTSGLLVEVPGTRTSRMVIGIGINVNNSLSDGPDELRERATSLIDEYEVPLDRTELLLRVLGGLDASLTQLAGEPPALVDRWRSFCLLTGRVVLLRVGADELLGECRGVDDAGAILLETPGGLQRYSSGVVVRFD